MTTYRKSMSEALNQVYLGEDNMALLKKAAGGAMQTLKMKDGKVKMDSFTASAIMQVYKAINPKNKKTMENVVNTGTITALQKLQALAMRAIKSGDEVEHDGEELDEDIMPLIFGGGIIAGLLPVLYLSAKEIAGPSIGKLVDKLKKNKNYKMSDSEKSDVKGFVSKVKKDKPSLLQKAMKNIKEEVDLDENTWQVVRNYADGKFSPSPMQGFRTEKEAQKRAAELNKKEKTKDTFSVRYNTMKFRGESYDIGTDEYSKHTMDTTPGQNNEDYLKQLHGKNYSMREALAKVWNVDEGKSPFEPEKKIKLSDAMKDGKTDTGKKMTKVTVSENKEAEKIIIDTLKKEGGAAGMSALEKAVKDKGIDVDVKDLVSKMSNVKTHEHGDIILEGRMGELSAAAKDIEKSAKKMSGQDKQELMTIVGMIKRTELSNLAKEIKSQDTEIRELILDKMLDNMSKSDVERALGIKFGRSGFVSDFDIK